MRFSYYSILIILFATLLSTGCGRSDPASADVDTDLMNELLGPEAELTGQTLRSESETDRDGFHESQTDPVRNRVITVGKSSDIGSGRKPTPPSPAGEKLELSLKLGDRFPLVKTVEQTLIQRSDVVPAMARTKLELTLIITVEEVRRDALRLGVRYSRVAYQHDVNGQQLSYDSASHRGAVPWDVIPYAGMVENGFSFWLGRNNSIRELVGYKDFLERCVANVPLERRETLLSEISHRFGDDGVANFVDDTIGLLPYDSTVDEDSATRVMPGDLWTRERRLMQPIPIHLTSTYRLLTLNESSAEIEITGRVATGEAGGRSNAGRLRIIGGQSLGHCVVDRATGLPLEMNLSRFIKMQLTTADNQSVIQEKQIQTTIRSYPETRGTTVNAEHRNTGIQPVGAVRTQGNLPQQNPAHAGSGRPVHAVYPN